MRAFVAVELDDHARTRLAALIESLRSSLGPHARALAFAKPATLHLTLKFLGETSDAVLPRLGDALAEVAGDTTPFELGLAGVGTFPERGSPHVVWAGVRGDVDRLATLAERIDLATSTFGFAREARPFTPHLTLARVKDRRSGRALMSSLQKLSAEDVCRFGVDSFTLFRSDTKPDGAIHTPLRVFAFE